MKLYTLEIEKKTGEKYATYFICSRFECAVVELDRFISITVSHGEQYVARIISEKSGRCVKCVKKSC